MRRWTSVVVLLCALAGSTSAERMRARDGTVRDVPAASVEYALKEGYERIPRVPMRHTDGSMVYVYEDEAKEAESRGFWRMGAEEEAAEIARAKKPEPILSLISPEGTPHNVPWSEAAPLLAAGWHQRTPEDTSRLATEAAREMDRQNAGIGDWLPAIVGDNKGLIVVIASILAITALLKPWRYW